MSSSCIVKLTVQDFGRDKIEFIQKISILGSEIMDLRTTENGFRTWDNRFRFRLFPKVNCKG